MSRGTAVILANTVFEIDNRVRKEAEALTAAGFRVTRVGFIRFVDDARHESTDAGDIVRIPNARGMKPQVRETVAAGGASRPKSVRARVKGLAKHFITNGLIHDVLNYLVRIEQNRLLFERVAPMAPDLVISVDLLTLPAGSMLKRKTGAALVYDSHEFAVGQANYSWLRRNLYRRMERRHIRTADRVVTVGPVLAREMSVLHRVREPEVVYNGPSECTQEPTTVHAPVRILFQGGLHANRGLLPLVVGMVRLRGKAVLTLQGYGVMEPQLRDAVHRLELDDAVSFAGRYDPRDVIALGRDHDIGIIPYPMTTKQLEITTPNKVLDYLGAGLAIATVDAPGITEVFDVDTCGVTFDPRDVDGMFDVLDGLVSDTARLTAMKRASCLAGDDFVWSRQAAVLLDVVDQVTGERE